MSDDSVYHLDLIIDDLTNSIRRIENGESFETEISLATSDDIKSAIKKMAGIFHGELNLAKPTGRCTN
jgi:hypothetical protein